MAHVLSRFTFIYEDFLNEDLKAQLRNTTMVVILHFQSCRAQGQASFNLNLIIYCKSEVLKVPDDMDLKIWSSPCKGTPL